MTLHRKRWIEGSILVVIGLVSSAESLRLVFYRDPHVIYDPLGPGYYLLLMSIGILVTGIIHTINRRQSLSEISVPVESITKKRRIRVAACIGAIAGYLLLIDFIGYTVATFIFFILIFRIVGMRTWRFIFMLAVIFSVAFHVVFVRFCNMIFPKGILFS